MDEETRVFLHVAGIAEPFNVISELFLKELRWFESQYRHIYTYIYIYIHIHIFFDVLYLCWLLVSALTCILVLVVSMFTARSCEFTQKYQYLPNC